MQAQGISRKPQINRFENPPSAVTQQRFQLVSLRSEKDYGNNVAPLITTTVVKLDTFTGKTWRVSYDTIRGSNGNYKLTGIRYAPLIVGGKGLPNSSVDSRTRYQISQGGAHAFLLNIETGDTWALNLDAILDGWNPFNDTQSDSQTSNPRTTPVSGERSTGYEINKRPLVDFANFVNDLLDKKQVSLDSAFVINAGGRLTADGKLEPKSFRWGEISSQDPKMVDVVKYAIAAVNDSGYLQYLRDVSGKDFNLLLQQDDANISAVIQSEMESETRARSVSSALGLAVSIAKKAKSGDGADEKDREDLILLENATFEAAGKKIVIRFQVPKAIALPMIQRKLAEQRGQPK